MAQPNQQQSQPGQPGQPTPEDPRTREPIHDPPVNPEQDPPEKPVRQAGGVKAPNPSPDEIVFDENETGR